MSAMMLGQAGTGASAGGAGGGALLLETTFIVSFVFSGSDRPQTAFRGKTDGVAQKATGDTGSPLSYVSLPNDVWHTGHPITGSNYEIYFDSTTNSATGEAGTWFGSTRDSWIALGSERTWIWEKDTTSAGPAEHIILIEIRNIATPATTTGVQTFTFTSSFGFA